MPARCRYGSAILFGDNRACHGGHSLEFVLESLEYRWTAQWLVPGEGRCMSSKPNGPRSSGLEFVYCLLSPIRCLFENHNSRVFVLITVIIPSKLDMRGGELASREEQPGILRRQRQGRGQ